MAHKYMINNSAKILYSGILGTVIPSMVASIDIYVNNSKNTTLLDAFYLVFIFGSIPTAVIFGVPAFFLSKIFLHPTVVNSCTVGAAVASFPWILFAIFAKPDGSSIGDNILIQDSKINSLGIILYAQGILQVALLGVLGGLVFWFVGLNGNIRESSDESSSHLRS